MPLSKTILPSLLRRTDLTREQAAWAMSKIVGGELDPVQVAGFAAALRTKGETAAELTGLVEASLASALPVVIPGPVVDIAGTGGDGTGAVNISTMAAVVAAATGVTVVKHGGRAASSATAGAADLVEQLGVRLDLSPAQAARVAAEAGITFLFAPRYHPGLRHVAAVRRSLGVPTVFNVLGPLINPAAPGHQVVGVADARLAPLVADMFAGRGVQALVVRGDDGLDKLTTTTTSRVWTVRDGTVRATVLDPARLGLARAVPAQLRGGDAVHNARIARAVFGGEPGPIRDVVLLNAAAMLVAVDGRSFPAALARCAEVVGSGAATATVERWVAASRSCVG
ncbi:anthranilate phosphoribosyltransferase [Actinoplanes palleronii]|uniref:Anthranilate phosphoribosyltransferase n=1 Tax=Actinoplanes palleronii TaxID=113570 RepID=A0ABQ4BAN9_9ACTN|nr:anthranilate phosphoribosyltransferase [Actinoplanes palleronii]GIE67315.1 anthranilate phosphoribosyltransferase [Actinoplanes palleronii]